MTISMLALAGIPATAGFIGKFNLIQAAVDGSYTWLGVFIVIGSMISLAYYLRIVAVVWSGAPERAAVPVMAGGSQELVPAAAEPSAVERDPAVGGPGGAGWEGYALAVVSGAASLALGIVPQPLFGLARDAGAALAGLL